MPTDYGQQTIGVVGTSVQLLASGFHDVRWKVGAITLDWSKVVAVVADTTLTGGTTIKAGQKYIPMGTVLLKELAGAANPGYYAPYNSADTFGLGTMDATRIGEVFLVNEDIAENPPMGLIGGAATAHPPGLDGGTVWKARLQVGSAGQPTWAMFFAALPNVVPIMM